MLLLVGILLSVGVLPEAKSHDWINFKELATVSLLACQFGAQIHLSRLVDCNAIPTSVLTSVYCDEMVALGRRVRGMHADRRGRWERLGAVLAILVGAIVSGFINKANGGFKKTLWIAAGIKAVIVFTLVFWTSCSEDDAEEVNKQDV